MDKIKKHIPRWAILISLVSFILIGIGIGISLLYQLSIIYAEPGIVFVEILFLIALFYFLVYIPTIIMYDYFKCFKSKIDQN